MTDDPEGGRPLTSQGDRPRRTPTRWPRVLGRPASGTVSQQVPAAEASLSAELRDPRELTQEGRRSGSELCQRRPTLLVFRLTSQSSCRGARGPEPHLHSSLETQVPGALPLSALVFYVFPTLLYSRINMSGLLGLREILTCFP